MQKKGKDTVTWDELKKTGILYHLKCKEDLEEGEGIEGTEEANNVEESEDVRIRYSGIIDGKKYEKSEIREV